MLERNAVASPPQSPARLEGRKTFRSDDRQRENSCCDTTSTGPAHPPKLPDPWHIKAREVVIDDRPCHPPPASWSGYSTA